MHEGCNFQASNSRFRKKSNVDCAVRRVSYEKIESKIKQMEIANKL